MQILGGADLFLQGVLAPEGGLGDWLAGSVRTVTIPGNHIPFAVGRMAVSKVRQLRTGHPILLQPWLIVLGAGHSNNFPATVVWACG